MGIVSFSLSTRMKLLCVVALVAGVRAEAEADPQLLYSGIYPGVYSHAIHAPVVQSVEVKPAEVKTVPLTYTLPYAGAFPYTYGAYPFHFPYGLVPAIKPAEAEAPAVEAERKKREAEPVAEPDAAPDAEADPWFAYSGYHPYAYGYHPYAAYHPVVKTIKPVETKVIKAPTYTYSYNHAYHPYTYGYAGYPYAYGAYGYGWPYLTAVRLPRRLRSRLWKPSGRSARLTRQFCTAAPLSRLPPPSPTLVSPTLVSPTLPGSCPPPTPAPLPTPATPPLTPPDTPMPPDTSTANRQPAQVFTWLVMFTKTK